MTNETPSTYFFQGKFFHDFVIAYKLLHGEESSDRLNLAEKDIKRQKATATQKLNEKQGRGW